MVQVRRRGWHGEGRALKPLPELSALERLPEESMRALPDPGVGPAGADVSKASPIWGPAKDTTRTLGPREDSPKREVPSPFLIALLRALSAWSS
jgi:hypothetical protein